MDFVPPRCPHPLCKEHVQPSAGFYERRGYYQPKCRNEPVPRFRCKTCRLGFSRQTFRHDYYDHRPESNVPLFLLLVSGVGIRQAARLLGLHPQSVQIKKLKLGKTLSNLHHNFCRSLPAERTYQLDEEETFETASIRPLTMPVLIERATWFVVATTVGTIRRLAKRGSRRRARQDRDEKRQRRLDQSSSCVVRVLDDLSRLLPKGSCFTLQTDEKKTYATIARQLFGDRVKHETTSSRKVRRTFNPLFPINTTLAMTRDNCGRLRRRSWLVTKKAERLTNHMFLFTAYRNYVRRRFNHDSEADTPAAILGLMPRQLHRHEVLAWRQDWRDRSIHPMSLDGARTVRDPVAV
jgi:transposase-like protein